MCKFPWHRIRLAANLRIKCKLYRDDATLSSPSDLYTDSDSDLDYMHIQFHCQLVVARAEPLMKAARH